jgi:tetratricopeptide (TPR) repeat protein
VASRKREVEHDGILAALPGALEECILAAARRVPLLVAVDDVDRADLESAALLLTLSRAARSEPLVVLVTATIRPLDEQSAAVRVLRDTGTSLRLRELTQQGVTELVRTAFGGVSHGPRTAMRLHTATGGNPGRCMRLLRVLVDDGLIRYDAGVWSLPIEIPPEMLRAEHAATERLRRCHEHARRLATLLAIRNEPARLDWFVALEGRSSSRRVIASIEELVVADVLVEGAAGYSFCDLLQRDAALELAPSGELDELRIRVGEALLAAASTDVAKIGAARHLIEGGDEMRGARIATQTACKILDDEPEAARVLATVVPGLEAALDVYRRHRQGSSTLLSALVPLTIASYEHSSALARRYGEETITRLERVLGLPPSSEESAPLELEGLLSVLQRAPVLEDGETPGADAPDVVRLVTWLTSTAITLVAVAATVIDYVVEERFTRALRPFVAFGPSHPGAFAHEFCQLITSMTADHLAASHAGWLRMLDRLGEVPLPPAIRERLRRGAIYALGVLESQRDDSAALARIRELESLNGAQNVAIANQLRFLFHGFRGEAELAQRCRDRVEEFAVQYGSAWQIEIWSSCTATAFYGTTRDVVGNKRVLEQLERLKKESPSLEIYWERSVASHFSLTGAHERALEVYERTLAKSRPRERVGWSAVRGAMARTYNELGEHEVAKGICEETIALSRDDFDFVAMTLLVRIELSRSLAGLGEFAAAKQHLTFMLDQYLPNENPATLSAIYRTFAEIAILEGDTVVFEQHLADMRRWVTATKNPALIAQCDQLRSSVRAAQALTTAVPATGALATTMQTFVQSVFASCEGAAARKQRALELAATQAGTRDAWLFTLDGREEVVLAGRLNVSDAPQDLYGLVKNLFEEAIDSSDETEYMQTAPLMDLTAMPDSLYRLLPLTVSQGEKRILVGTIAIPTQATLKPVSHDLLQDIATQLFQAGDIATVRTFC